jgi:GNAT superfamily N-acetyltransferase
MDEIVLSGYRPGALGRVTELHGSYYAAHWGLDLYFEAKVATELAAFLNHFDPERDGAWFATLQADIVGSIFINGGDDREEARLRWFIVDPQHQGLGVGNKLISAAMEFCTKKDFKRVYLTTFAGLDSARHLYEKFGFRLQREEDGSHLTGKSSLVKQVFEYHSP